MTSILIDRRALGAVVLGGIVTRASMAQGMRAERTPSGPGSGSTAARKLEALEAAGGGRVGVMAVDTGSGKTVEYRIDERFPMCSTHKVLVAAAILSMIEDGRLRTDQRVPFGQVDLLEYAPITKKNLGAGFMTVEALCEASVRWSDNTADNLLLKLLGGPTAWTRYARSLNDWVSRLDRFEPELNSAIIGDVRDTSSPKAMAGTLAALLLGSALKEGSRLRLRAWMSDSPITGTLLRKGLPDGWIVADKSGSGSNGSRNDVGVLYPPRSAPIVICAFYTGSTKSGAEREHVIAQCAGIVASELRPPATATSLSTDRP